MCSCIDVIEPFLQFNMSKDGEEIPADGKMDEQLDNIVSLGCQIPNEVNFFITIRENMQQKSSVTF